MKTGLVLPYSPDFEGEVRWCLDHGIPTIQLHMYPPQTLTDEASTHIRDVVQRTGIEISALISLWSGPMAWNFVDGPATLGLVPTAYRHQRLSELIRAAHFAKSIGAPDMNTHMGFIPEQPNDPLYRDFLPAARQLAQVCEALQIGLNFETGQETPITLLRAIQDIGSPCVGINFDPANLMMYGKANPVDALDILGPYVRGVHAKDGEYPTDPANLGEEKALGEGRANFPALIEKLKQHGYDGPLTIEREITGPEQKRDVLAANELLKSMI